MMSRSIGIVGAGHLGVALAARLIEVGFDRGRVWLGHRGSQASHAISTAAGVADRLARVDEVIRYCDILLYTVRPADFGMISGYALRDGQALISFLAGVPLAKLRDAARGSGAVTRAIISAPDTIALGQSLGATHGEADAPARALLDAMGAQRLSVSSEDKFEPVTVLGTCLPFILMYCDHLKIEVREDDIVRCAADFGLGEWRAIIDWARRVKPGACDARDMARYIDHAATPGGVAERIMHSLRGHGDFARTVAESVEHAKSLAVSVS
jgi:pyrroline-5-carboxylate reductase